MVLNFKKPELRIEPQPYTMGKYILVAKGRIGGVP